jgi:hypothetical protein
MGMQLHRLGSKHWSSEDQNGSDSADFCHRLDNPASHARYSRDQEFSAKASARFLHQRLCRLLTDQSMVASTTIAMPSIFCTAWDDIRYVLSNPSAFRMLHMLTGLPSTNAILASVNSKAGP